MSDAMMQTVEVEADKSLERLNFDPRAGFVPGGGAPPQQLGIETYTVEEVAKMLGVCDQTVRRYIKVGDLEGWQLGNFYKIPKYALDEYLAGCRLKAVGVAREAKGHRFEPLLTPEEVQKFLRIGQDAFRKLVRLDELPVIWIGGSIRIQPAALQAWINDKDRRRKGGNVEKTPRGQTREEV